MGPAPRNRVLAYPRGVHELVSEGATRHIRTRLDRACGGAVTSDPCQATTRVTSLDDEKATPVGGGGASPSVPEEGLTPGRTRLTPA
jgi:hypothetical protein